jgi:hypothetical protein
MYMFSLRVSMLVLTLYLSSWLLSKQAYKLIIELNYHYYHYCVIIMFILPLNVAYLSQKQLAFVFLLVTYVAFLCSGAPPATALQLDVLLLLMQLVNL